MINKKIVFRLLILCSLGACTSPTAMLGPAYTLSSTGNIAQTGLSFGSDKLITYYTGRTPFENLEEITNKSLTTKNFQRQTLESEDFYQLVKYKIEKNKGKIKLSNQ